MLRPGMEPVEEVCSQGTEVTRLDKAARQFTAEHVRLGLHVPVERKDLLKAVGSLAKNASR